MRFSLDWMRAYVELPEEPQGIAEILGQAGFPVDSLEPWGADVRLDVDVMANRADCMCHLGLAREVSARAHRPLTIPQPRPDRGETRACDLASVQIDAPDLCSRYSAMVVTGVTVGRSPDWIEDRLASIGQRPINNIVDATNFVLYEMGQPLHAFDLDRLDGARIVVRRAGRDKSLRTLDGQERLLRPDDLVIADASRPVALAGIMGGAETEIGPSTTRILLESAYFQPQTIRRTGRALDLRTDASHRFERGTDVGATLTAAMRAASLILEGGGGQVASGEIDTQPVPLVARRIRLSLSRLASLLGLDVKVHDVRAALAALGFAVLPPASPDGAVVLDVSVPTWRPDVEQEVDLIEEVARVMGYESIPSTLPAFNTGQTATNSPSLEPDKVRTFLASAGFSEAINYPMVEATSQQPFTTLLDRDHTLVRLDNPMNSQMDVMRISLLPGLLQNIVQNRNRGQEDVKLFEVGKVFSDAKTGPSAPSAPSGSPSGPPLPLERLLLAAVGCGHRYPPHWQRSQEPFDFFDLKGVLEELSDRLWEPLDVKSPASPAELPFLAADEAGWVRRDGKRLGIIGRIAPPLAAAYEIPESTYLLEVELVPEARRRDDLLYLPIPRQPAAGRDLALVVDVGVPYQRILAVIRHAAGEWLEAVHLFDRYSGHPIPEGKVSLAVHLTFRNPTRSLTHAEIQALQDRTLEALKNEVHVTLRKSEEGT
ncbi:MAG: phenylalanine--tRNA ligase subunit beta [Acidobacteriota bacterium]